MNFDDKNLNTIKTTVKRYIQDAETMLFGSRAKESASSESDFDILIITFKTLTSKQKLTFKTKIRKELLSKGIRSDVFIQSKMEIQKRKICLVM